MADRGRSRGRARGRPTPPVGQSEQLSSLDTMASLQQTLPPTPRPGQGLYASGDSPESGSSGGNGSGNGNGTAVRARATFRSRGPPVTTRPNFVKSKKGTGGRNVNLLANYFRLNTPQNSIVFDYHLDFEPEIDSRFVRKALVFSAVREAFSDRLLFDGMSNLKSTIRLPLEEMEFYATRSADQTQVRIRVRLSGEIGWGHNEMFRLYNTQMRRNLHLLKWNLIGRHYFNPNITHTIPEHRLVVLQGLMTAINRHDESILMVADTVHKIIRSDSVLENMNDIYRRDNQGFNDNVRRELSGSIVITKYNHKTYRVDDIAFDKNPNTRFDRKGTSISFVEYYLQQYRIKIQDTSQPLLIALPSVREQRAGEPKPILLVPELCNMTGISDSMANDFSIRRALTQKTQQDPNLRVQQLRQFIQSMTNHPEVKQDMSKWGLVFDTDLVEVSGRLMDCERILMHGQTNQQTGTPWDQKAGDFSKEIRGKAMFSACNISNWAILCSRRDSNIVEDFSQTLSRVCRPMGMSLSRPTVHTVDNDRTSTFVEASRAVTRDVQIVVIILPNNNKDRYDAIKKVFCCEHPMASQLVVMRTLSKRQMLMSVCTKIGIQMACKLGAQPWVLEMPPPNLMVVGFDVNRDSAQRERAIGAFVCSTNSTICKWYSCVSQHRNREELSNNFRSNIQMGLKKYFEYNKRPPGIIVIYRDGVSEGDIEYVFNYELKQIEEAIKSIFSDTPIKLCFTIVTKRINTRFFQSVGPNQFNNPIPGTVVDAVVTREERYDFYLISQSVRQGTVTPTMYNIIKDDTRWAPHRHQQLAYKLTHLYYNWIGTIRVPAPCQYAHKLAYLTGTHLHRPFHTLLSDSLFYL